MNFRSPEQLRPVTFIQGDWYYAEETRRNRALESWWKAIPVTPEQILQIQQRKRWAVECVGNNPVAAYLSCLQFHPPYNGLLLATLESEFSHTYFPHQLDSEIEPAHVLFQKTDACMLEAGLVARGLPANYVYQPAQGRIVNTNEGISGRYHPPRVYAALEAIRNGKRY